MEGAAAIVNAAVPVIGVLALQGDVREHIQILQALGADAHPIRRPAELAAVDGVVIPGGESTTMSRLLDAFELREPLLARLRSGLPAYGSCAGMITLARRVLDGTTDQVPLGVLDITVRRNAFGRQVDSFETPLRCAGIPGGPFPAVFIRAPWVESAGPDVDVLASVTMTLPADPSAGRPQPVEQTRPVAVRQDAVLATSFHPEMTTDHRIHRLFLDIVAAS